MILIFTLTFSFFIYYFCRETYPMILVANKVDLVQQRKVNEENGKALAADLGVSNKSNSWELPVDRGLIQGVSKKKYGIANYQYLRMATHNNVILSDITNTTYLVVCEVSAPYVKGNELWRVKQDLRSV